MTLSQLHSPIIFHIASFLNRHDLNSMTRTNKHLHDLFLYQLYHNDIQNQYFRAIHHHCENGHIDALRGLLAAVKTVDAPTQRKWIRYLDPFVSSPSVREVGTRRRRQKTNPMYEAIRNGHIVVVEYLLSEHALCVNTSSSDSRKQSGLDIAAEMGDLDMVKLLLRAGAGIFSSSSCGLALHEAVWNGHEELAAFLLAEMKKMVYEELSPAVPDDIAHGTTLPMEDTSTQRLSEAEYHCLIWPLLLTAIDKQNIGLVELLIPEVPSLNVEPGKILFNAVEARNLELVKLLLWHGVNPDITRDNEEYNVTLWAAALGLSDIVEALLDGGADPNFADGNGRTPLSLAAEKGGAQMVQVLLAHGASVELRDSVRYWKPLDWAMYAEKTDIVDILQPLTPADYF
ncbi:ankyrin repeat-containing domain protein [Aspergillus germanicus]